MSDPLADALNRIAANPQSAAITPSPTAQASTNPLGPNPMPRWQRIAATTLPEIAGDVISAPTNLYSLLDLGSQWAFNKSLPGAERAREISDNIRKPISEMDDRIAGEPISNNLLSGDPLQVGAAWVRLGLGAGISAPVGVANAITQGASKLKSGVAVVDAIGTGLAKTLEALTPITIAAKPTMKQAGINMGVAGAIGAGVEAIIGPEHVAAADSQAKGALDVAAQGVQEIRHAKQAITQAGLTDDPAMGIAAIGLLSAGMLYGYKREAINRVIRGARDNIKSMATGIDATDPNQATVQSLATQLKTQHVDANDSIPTSWRKGMESRREPGAWEAHDRVAEELSYRTGPSVDTRAKTAWREGTLPDSTVKVPPTYDVELGFKSLNESQQRAAWERAIYRQELDARQTLLRDKYGVNVGNIGSAGADKVLLGMENAGTMPRHHLFDKSSRELRDAIQRADSDPQIAQLNSQLLETTKKMRDYMAEQRFRTRADVVKMGQENPNYVPQRMAPGESYMKRFDQSERGGLATLEEIGNPYAHLRSYMDEVIRGAEADKVRRSFLGPMMRQQDRGDVYASSLLGRRDVDVGPNARDKFVTYRGPNGEKRNIEVKDAVLRNALHGLSNPTTLQMMSGWASTAARFFESASVGATALSTATNFFAPVSAAYTAAVGLATRSPGVAAGRLDRVLQDVTKKHFGSPTGLRGDPTFMPEVAFKAIQNLDAVMIDRMARVLHNSVIKDGVVASAYDKVLGPGAAEATAKGLSDWFKQTHVYELQQRGIMGPANSGLVDPSRMYNHARSVLETNGIPARTGTFIGDMLHAITSAPSAVVMDLNKGRLPAWQVSHAARTFAGDAGRSGAFKGGLGRGLGEATNATPWMNLQIQGYAKLAEAIRRNPIATATGIFNTIAIPAMGITMWNAAAGEEYVDYQLRERPADKRLSSNYIAVPGRPPNMGIEWPVEPSLRVYKTMSELIAATHLGLIDNSHYHPENDDVRRGIKEATMHGIFSLGEGSLGKSLIEQSILPPMSPVVALPLAIGGVEARSYIDYRNIREAKNAGFTEGEMSNPRSKFLDQYLPAQTEAIIKSIASSAGKNIFNHIMDFGARMEAGQGFGESMRQQGNAAKMRMADSTKWAGSGPLFDTFLAVSPSMEASGVLVKEKLDGLRNFSEAYTSSTPDKQVFVGTKKSGYETRLGQGPVAPPDLLTAQMGEQAKGIYKQLNDAYSAQNKKWFEQRSGIQNDPTKSPEMKRYLMNEFGERIIDNNRRMLQDILRYEAIVSGMFGTEIKFDKLNRSKGVQ